MSREQIIKIAMVVCVVVLLCAVIVSTTGLFGVNGISGYANADQYTAGDTEITRTVKRIEINWTSGKLNLLHHAENTVTLQETAKRELKDDEKVQWWLDGETLRIQFSKPGIRMSMPEKELTLMLPEGIKLDHAELTATSADVVIDSLEAEELKVNTTSGDVKAQAEAGVIEMSSTSGDIHLTVTGHAEMARAHATSGNIVLAAEDVKNIDISSTSGEIDITADKNSDADIASTSGSVRLTLKEMGKVSVTGTSGNVTAALPEDPGFSAEVNSVSGKVTCEMALKQEGGRYTCGDESGKVHITTTSGNIRLEAAEKK